MGKFTTDKDVALMNEIKKQRALYDRNHEDFKNTEIRNNYWERVSEKVELSVADCKQRWQNLRKRYLLKKQKGLTKWPNGTSGCDYMSLLSFVPDTTDCSIITKGTTMKKIQKRKKRGAKPHVTYVRGSSEEVEQKYQIPIQNADENKHLSVQNILEPEVNITTAQVLNESAASYKSSTHKFFETMADIVEKLPLHLQAQIRLKVCHVVTEVEIKHHRQELVDSLCEHSAALG